jgi:hypothetical protein
MESQQCTWHWDGSWRDPGTVVVGWAWAWGKNGKVVTTIHYPTPAIAIDASPCDAPVKCRGVVYQGFGKRMARWVGARGIHAMEVSKSFVP